MRLRFPRFLVLALASVLVLQGCIAGNKARDHVLAPTVQSVSPRVVADASQAPDVDLAVLGEFTTAVEAADWFKVSTLWPQVRDYANRGIDAKVAQGKIGPTVAGSLRERVRQFDTDLGKLTGRLP